MSDYNPFVEGGEPSPPEGGPEIDLGVATGDGQPTDQEGPKNYLDVDSYGDHYARVRVDGEELEVPLKEALQGYSRTADYTRKTQQLAAERQQAEYALSVQRALQAQPAATLSVLGQIYGVPIGQSPPQYAEAPSPYDDGPYDDDDVFQDPIERRLAQQEQVIGQMNQQLQLRQADEVLQRTIGGLQQRYNLDQSTIREIIGTALQTNRGPESFEMIYKNLAFDRAQAARAQMQQTRQTTEQQRRAAGMAASQVVSSGPSANSAGAPLNGASDGPMSIRDAFNAALSEHGGQLPSF